MYGIFIHDNDRESSLCEHLETIPLWPWPSCCEQEILNVDEEEDLAVASSSSCRGGKLM